MLKFMATISVILLVVGYNSSAFGVTVVDLMFAISSGTERYTISNFDQGQKSGCGNYINGSNSHHLTPGGSLSCSVSYSDLGTFTLTVTNPSGQECTIQSTKTSPAYIFTSNCSLPGVVVVNTDKNPKDYLYGNWYVNLQ